MDLKTKTSLMRQEVNDYLVITFGLLLYALGWTAFLLPYQISTGGLTGISAIVYYLTGIELQNTYFAVNLIFLIVAVKILGFKFCIKTIYAVFALCRIVLVSRSSRRALPHLRFCQILC